MVSRVLFQLDPDPHPSAFDSVVAIDAGVDQLLRYHNVQPDQVTALAHGAMFTRGGDQLRSTAIFIGGSDVAAAEELLATCQKAFFGPARVSLMLDANGCNTTASAAVVAASRHLDLSGARAVVLGGTGPVGYRVAQLLASDGAQVCVTSRSQARAADAAKKLDAMDLPGSVSPAAIESSQQVGSVLKDAQIVIGCGAAGVELVGEATMKQLDSLVVAIDLNAVPPAGIGGIEVTAKAAEYGNGVCYGAIGVGGLKMKTHRAAIESLFTANDKVLDAAEIYAIAKSIG